VLLAIAIVIVIPSIIWIGSIFVDEPQREVLVWIAIFFDTLGNDFLLVLLDGRLVPEILKTMIDKLFQFFPGNLKVQFPFQGSFSNVM